MDTLKVTFFGRFSLYWRGAEIVPGRHASSKFLRLLQIVWMYNEEGVSRHKLLEFLYHDVELTNPDNSLNNLIFQMRRQMAAAGLPKMNYIVLRNRRYYPDPEVPMEVDLWEFRSAILRARGAQSEEEKEAGYLHALECYQGAFLPESRAQEWVIMESARVTDEYTEACRFAGARAKALGDYQGMLDIYEKAARDFPDQGWQAQQVEALILLHKIPEAYAVYQHAIERYSRKTGSALPSGQSAKEQQMLRDMMTSFRKISGNGPEEREGGLGMFLVQVTDRQNSTWQGEVIYAQENRRVRFHSALELLRFIDDAIASSALEEKDAEAPLEE